MEKQLLAIGYPSYSNYIKLPQSVLVEFNQPKDFDKFKNTPNIQQNLRKRKSKGIDLSQHLNDDFISAQVARINPPYYFQVESSIGTQTYCGVLEFTAEEGFVEIPHTILKHLMIEGSDFVTIRYIGNVPKGGYVLIEPLDKEIFDIPDLDKYLEQVLSAHCLLVEGQIVDCEFQGKIFQILIKNIKPKLELDIPQFKIPLIDIVNTDIKFDIFNKFLEEELKAKKLAEEVERKKKEEEKANREKQLVNKVESNGRKLGGIQVDDPNLMREIRLQKLMESWKSNPIPKPIIKPQTLPTTNSNQIDKINFQPISDSKSKSVGQKKPKEFDV